MHTDRHNLLLDQFYVHLCSNILCITLAVNCLLLLVCKSSMRMSLNVIKKLQQLNQFPKDAGGAF